jgi:hypothetical protein
MRSSSWSSTEQAPSDKSRMDLSHYMTVHELLLSLPRNMNRDKQLDKQQQVQQRVQLQLDVVDEGDEEDLVEENLKIAWQYRHVYPQLILFRYLIHSLSH